MAEYKKDGFHFIGYFSKEKGFDLNYNVSCILTMPLHQQMGYEQFLIDFSYLLSQKENKWGTPERPFSSLDEISYKSYWKQKAFELLVNNENISIEEIPSRSSIKPGDILRSCEYVLMISLIHLIHSESKSLVSMLLHSKIKPTLLLNSRFIISPFTPQHAYLYLDAFQSCVFLNLVS